MCWFSLARRQASVSHITHVQCTSKSCRWGQEHFIRSAFFRITFSVSSNAIFFILEYASPVKLPRLRSGARVRHNRLLVSVSPETLYTVHRISAGCVRMCVTYNLWYQNMDLKILEWFRIVGRVKDNMSVLFALKTIWMLLLGCDGMTFSKTEI
jgi:hypothetical protein